jgi:gas vesicle protein
VEDTKGLSYFFLGLGIGVAVGMIFAPQSGSETRTLIRSRAGEGGDYIRRRGEQLREGASGLIDRGKDAVARGREQFGAAVQAGRQTYRDALGGPGQASEPGGAPPAASPEGI